MKHVLLTGCLLLILGITASAQSVFINELHYDNDGADTGEALEVAGPAATDLSGWSLVLYNGTDSQRSPYDEISLSGVIPNQQGGYGTVAFTRAGIQNGSPDGVALVDANGVVIQFLSYEGSFVAASGPAEGRTSEDIGVEETSGTPVGFSLQLMGTGATYGDFSWSDPSDDSFGAVNTGQTFGEGGPTPEATLLINEIDADQEGTDASEFIELYDGGAGTTRLDGFVVVLYNGSNDQVYDAIDLSGQTTDADGYFVIGSSSVPNVDLVDFTTNGLQNGADAVALYQGEASAFPLGTAVTTENLIDAIVYDTNDADDPELLALLNDGQPQVNEDENGAATAESLQRITNGSGGARNTSSYQALLPTPGAENGATVTPPGAITFIHDIQGAGFTSPLAGQTVTVEGIVVGDFQQGDGDAFDSDLDGFYVQEEPTDADSDAATSEGIFVYAPGAADVQAGDLVRVAGQVVEFGDPGQSLTELTNVTVTVTGQEALPSPVAVNFPATDEQLEAVEGMYVTFPQELVLSEYFNYDRFGEVVLAFPEEGRDRLYQPTSYINPDNAEAIDAAQEAIAQRIITLDDGRTAQNPDPARHPNGEEFTLDNRFRGGDLVQNATGVMDYRFDLYRLQPTEGADYTANNPRTAQPKAVGGTLKVASFNVLNYFTDFGARGADNQEEFARQRAKIIAAIGAIDADIVGLIEIQNNTEAIEDLVSGLNEAQGAGTYDYVNTGVIGTDEIKVAFIYQPATVETVGDFAVLTTADDPRFIDTRNRPPLAQTFREKATDETLTVVVNHLKSKGSGCGAGDDDPDQGNCTGTRTAAAEAIVDWLATDPTQSGDPDYMIIGDLNSYDLEDPIAALREGADDQMDTEDDFIDLLKAFEGEFAYSYLFDAQVGYLDYALVSRSLYEQITGATAWHINSDEPDLLDYDTSFKLDAQDSLYAADPYRSSDHDPVVVGVALAPEGIVLGDCKLGLDDFKGAAEIVAVSPILGGKKYPNYYKGSYVVGIATGFRTDGKAGIWEIHNDCRIRPVKRTGPLTYNTTLLPDVYGVERRWGWRYEPYAISDDGQYVLANAINERGYRTWKFTIEAGTVVSVKFKIGKPVLGRILSVSGTVDCAAQSTRYFGLYVVTGCKEGASARVASDEKETIALDPSSQASLEVFPNPVGDVMHLAVESASAEVADVTVYTLNGQAVYHQQHALEATRNSLEIDAASWGVHGELLLQVVLPTQGVYHLKLLKP